jgi:hypothetical protein
MAEEPSDWKEESALDRVARTERIVGTTSECRAEPSDHQRGRRCHSVYVSVLRTKDREVGVTHLGKRPAGTLLSQISLVLLILNKT